jgi:hypothetical protein
MILSDLQAEFQARGFDYLSVTRQNIFLNRAYQETCEGDDWPSSRIACASWGSWSGRSCSVTLPWGRAAELQAIAAR